MYIPVASGNKYRFRFHYSVPVSPMCNEDILQERRTERFQFRCCWLRSACKHVVAQGKLIAPWLKVPGRKGETALPIPDYFIQPSNNRSRKAMFPQTQHVAFSEEAAYIGNIALRKTTSVLYLRNILTSFSQDLLFT